MRTQYTRLDSSDGSQTYVYTLDTVAESVPFAVTFPLTAPALATDFVMHVAVVVVTLVQFAVAEAPVSVSVNGATKLVPTRFTTSYPPAPAKYVLVTLVSVGAFVYVHVALDVTRYWA
jgi:hypothetical protein